MDKRVIQARYATWRPVQTRKLLQLVFEVPLEKQAEVLKYLGAPLPDRDIQCAIAILNGEAGNNTSSADAPSSENPVSPTKQKFTDLPLTKQAVLLCKREAFQRYIQVENEQAAVEWLYDHCRTASRKDILEGTEQGEYFKDLYGRFQDWLNDPDAQAWEDDWEAGV